MSDREVVSTLVGKLLFEADTRQLTSFHRAMIAVSKKMSQLGAEATKLQNKLKLNFQATLKDDSGLGRLSKQVTKLQSQLNMSASVKADDSGFVRMSRLADELQRKLQMKMGITPAKEKAKLEAEIRRSAERELKMETHIAKAKRAVFTQELAGQRLQFANTKEQTFLQTSDLKLKQEVAVLQSKTQKAEQARLQTQEQGLKVERTLAENKARALRGEQMLSQQQARTALLRQREQAGLTSFQRLSLKLSEDRARAERGAAKFTQQQAADKVRSERQTEKHLQQQARFNGWQARQSVWQAAQDRPKEPDEGMGLLGIGGRLTGIAAGAYVVTKALDKLAERVQQRQEGASEAQQFNQALNVAGGKSVDNQRFARDRYLEISDKYGTEVSLEGAKDYAKFVQGQLALGKSLTQAAQIFEDQSATFRAAALSADGQKRAAYQLNQIRAKGKPEGSDVNDLFDAVGGPVASAIRAAAADRLGFKGPVEQQAGWFKGAVTAGQVKAADFDQGMTNYLKANQDILAQQMKSLDAEQQRNNTQRYIGDSRINSDIELTQAVQDNIKAHRELYDSMKPVREGMLSLDIVLTKLMTSVLRWLFDKDPENSGKRVDSLSPEKPAVDINALTGAEVPDNKPVPDSLYGALGRMFGSSPTLPADEGPEDQTGVWNPLPPRLPVPVSGADVQRIARDRRVGGSSSVDGVPAVTNTITNNTIPSINVTQNITTAPGVDAQGVADLVDEKLEGSLRERLAKELGYHQKEIE